MGNEFQIRVVTSLSQIDALEWDGLGKDRPTNPFVLHGFLNSLEESGSATSKTGWLGQHLLLETAERKLLGALPCYLKNHSQGEYVFDHGWADAFERAGGSYYPKLQCSVPFTPATGPRLLVPKTPDREIRMQALTSGLRQLSEQLGVSSAHVTFMEEDEWEAAGSDGYLQRTDQQFHWVNQSYSDFDGFLESLSSRKRKNIRKERRQALEGNGLSVEILHGPEICERTWDRFFSFYTDTGSRKWGRPYLTRAFFSQVGEALAERVLLIMAVRDGEYVAGAINFVGDECLYGRHWGCLEDHPCLHFEICYYQAIEYAIAKGLSRVEAGAQGAHKLARGYLPVITRSAHWITHPQFRSAVSDYLIQERDAVEMENEALTEHSPFKKGSKPDE